MLSEVKILIATPAAGGMVTAAYANALFKIIAAFRDQRPKTKFELQMSVGTDLHVMRNFFAAKFMSDASLTHLLFIDADTIVSPKLVSRLIDFGKPFVGSLVPFRSLNVERLHAVSRLSPSPDEILSLLLDYVAADELISINDTDQPQYKVTRGFVQTKRIGAGVTLLTREVFDTLKEGFPDLMIDGNEYYHKLGHNGPVLQCFSPLQSDDGVFFSEDISFCERWRKMDGEIWACVDEYISHIGPYAFTGRYVERMKHGLFQTE